MDPPQNLFLEDISSASYPLVLRYLIGFNTSIQFLFFWRGGGEGNYSSKFFSQTYNFDHYLAPFGSLNLKVFIFKPHPMIFQKVYLLCCVESMYVWCFKAPFMNMLSNIM